MFQRKETNNNVSYEMENKKKKNFCQLLMWKILTIFFFVLSFVSVDVVIVKYEINICNLKECPVRLSWKQMMWSAEDLWRPNKI